MLSVAEEYLRELNPEARLEVFGQELNDESYAICKADMMIKGQNPENIVRGNSLLRGRPRRARSSTTCSRTRRSAWSGRRSRRRSEDEHETQGFAGRFGAGLPRINDGSFLFLQHMISKMKPRRRGGRQPHRHRLQRLAALHRRRGLGRERDPPLDHRERLAGGHRRPARPALLQHRHQHLHLDRHQPEAEGAEGQGPAHQRRRPLREDAEVPRQQAQRAVAGEHRRRSPSSTATSRQGEQSKIFDNEDFGYRRIAVERPLRLNFQASPERHRAAQGGDGLPEPRRVEEEGRGRRSRRSRRAGSSRQQILDGARRASTRRARLQEPRRVRGGPRRGAREGRALKLPGAGREGDPLGALRAGRDGRGLPRRRGQPGARRRPARLRERPAEGGHPRLLRARGAAARPRRLDRRDEDEGRLRDPVHPALLQVHSRCGRSRRSRPRSGSWRRRSRGCSARCCGERALCSMANGSHQAVRHAWGIHGWRLDRSWFITDSGVRLLQTGNVGIGRFKEQGFRYISEESFTALRCTEVRPGDVLICRLADPVGRACLAPDLGVKMITSVDVAILRPTAHYDARFIVYALSSARYLGYLESICRGGTRDRVSRSMLGDVPVTVPPLPGSAPSPTSSTTRRPPSTRSSRRRSASSPSRRSGGRRPSTPS